MKIELTDTQRNYLVDLSTRPVDSVYVHPTSLKALRAKGLVAKRSVRLTGLGSQIANQIREGMLS